jgi:hypothetical protein
MVSALAHSMAAPAAPSRVAAAFRGVVVASTVVLEEAGIVEQN